MKYISTRGGTEPLSFSDTVLTGLARDGGLLLPDEIPDISDEFHQWHECSYVDVAFKVMRLFVDIPDEDLKQLIDKSYSTFRTPEITPMKRVGDLYVLELFHGPTLAFKDIALQFLGNLFEYLLEQRDAHLNIVAATSGDTGSAAIHGVRGKDRINIFVMHPRGRVSATQEKQMTSVLDDNVFNLAVDGTFDDCQSVLKQLFCDLEFRDRYCLGAVNSVNWARVLAQTVYYVYAALQLTGDRKADSVCFSVPTGNFGDIFAGFIAASMGVPVERLILATNENDILTRFFDSGVYQRGEVVATLSPSMDIQIASNFERYLYYLLNADSNAVSGMMNDFTQHGRLEVNLSDNCLNPQIVAGSGTTQDTLNTIQTCYENTGYLLDPHTAIGYAVAQRHRVQDVPAVCLATAHPAKFGDTIRRALGSDIARHPLLDALAGMPTRCDEISANVDELMQYMTQHIS